MAGENRSAGKLDKRKVKAAHLLADNLLSDKKIAQKVGVAESTLNTWKLLPEFAAEVTAQRRRLEDAVFGRGIAARIRRVEALTDRWERMQRVIRERSRDPQFQGVAGGKTGLLVHQVKGVGKGTDFRVVDEYAVDTGLLRELRELEKQAAQEMGQWVEKVAPTSPDGKEEYGRLSDEERLLASQRVLARLLAGRGLAAPGSSGNGHGNGDGPALGGPGPDHGASGFPS